MPVQLDHQSILQEMYSVLHQITIIYITGYFVKQGYCIHFIGEGGGGRGNYENLFVWIMKFWTAIVNVVFNGTKSGFSICIPFKIISSFLYFGKFRKLGM